MTWYNFIFSDIVCEKGKEANDILSRLDTLSRAFSNRRVFDETAQRISVVWTEGKRIEMYAFLKGNALV